MRSGQYWGLGTRLRYGEKLFVPSVVRAGFMRKSADHAVLRSEVIAAVTSAIGTSSTTSLSRS